MYTQINQIYNKYKGLKTPQTIMIQYYKLELVRHIPILVLILNLRNWILSPRPRNRNWHPLNDQLQSQQISDPFLIVI